MTIDSMSVLYWCMVFSFFASIECNVESMIHLIHAIHCDKKIQIGFGYVFIFKPKIITSLKQDSYGEREREGEKSLYLPDGWWNR